MRAYLHISDSELSDTESVKEAKAEATLKKKDELNKRAHKRVNAAHAEGKTVSLENTKPIRDIFVTNVKKEDIVPGFGKQKQQQKKHAAPKFDEAAYAARSIACHTLKPAPLRIPSRTKQPAVGGNSTDVKGTVQIKNPLAPGALQSNTNKTLGVEFVNEGVKESSGSGGSQTNPKAAPVNFSRPKTQHARGKNKYDFVDDPEESTEPVGEKGIAPTTQLSSGVRQSYTAREYQDLIQDVYDDFTHESPEKKQVQPAKTGAVIPKTTPASSSIISQTVVIGAHQQPAAHFSGTILPPTPAYSHRHKTTGEKMDELDDFFAEENDHIYTSSGPTGTSTGNGTQQQQDQPWNDPNYHEEALSYGYAYKKSNHRPLPDTMVPVALTLDQRRQVLAGYGMSEAEYPSPPAGYPNPPGPEQGTTAPPCPTRPAPAAPGSGSGIGSSRHSAEEAAVQSLRKHRRFQRAATAPPSSKAPESPAPGYDADWF